MATPSIDNSAPVGESSIMHDLWCVHAMLAGAESLLADEDNTPAQKALMIAHLAQKLIAKAIDDIDGYSMAMRSARQAISTAQA